MPILHRPLLALLVAVACVGAHAQSNDAQKTALAEHIVAIWKPEAAVVARFQQPAVEAVRQSSIMIQGRVTEAEKTKVSAEVQASAQRYLDTVTPVAKAAAAKDLPVVIVPMLVKNFSVDELKQIISMLESPVRAKFEQLGPTMQQALGEKVTTDIKPQIDPAIKKMTEDIGMKLRAAAQ